MSSIVNPSDYPITIDGLLNYMGTPDAWADLQHAIDVWFSSMCEIKPSFRQHMLDPGRREYGRETYSFTKGHSRSIISHNDESSKARDRLLFARGAFRSSIVARLETGDLLAAISEKRAGSEWIAVSPYEWRERHVRLWRKAVVEHGQPGKPTRTFSACFRDESGTPIDQAFRAYASENDQAEFVRLANLGAPGWLFVRPKYPDYRGRAWASINEGTDKARYAEHRQAFAAIIERAKATIIDHVRTGRLVVKDVEEHPVSFDSWTARGAASWDGALSVCSPAPSQNSGEATAKKKLGRKTLIDNPDVIQEIIDAVKSGGQTEAEIMKRASRLPGISDKQKVRRITKTIDPILWPENIKCEK